MKCCSKCKQLKPLCEFNKDRKFKDGLNIYCRACQSDYQNSPRAAARRAELKRTDKYKAKAAERAKRPEVKAKAAERAKRPEVKAKAAEYNKSPQGRVVNAKAQANYRAKHYGIRNHRRRHWQSSDITKRYLYQAGRCLGCYTPYELNELELDHNLPLVRGGESTYNNLLMLCRSCNASKATKTFAEWKELIKSSTMV